MAKVALDVKDDVTIAKLVKAGHSVTPVHIETVGALGKRDKVLTGIIIGVPDDKVTLSKSGLPEDPEEETSIHQWECDYCMRQGTEETPCIFSVKGTEAPASPFRCPYAITSDPEWKKVEHEKA